MKTDRIIGLRAAGPIILIGTIAVALTAHSFWTSRPALASLPEAPNTSVESTLEPIAVSRQPTPPVDPNSCETQHWPFYSKECLRGEVAPSIPRHVSLQQASASKTPLAAPVVAAIPNAEQKPHERREVLDTPRHRKVRQIARNTRRPAVRVRQMPQAEPAEFAPTLAFTW